MGFQLKTQIPLESLKNILVGDRLEEGSRNFEKPGKVKFHNDFEILFLFIIENPFE
ncbi:MAG TPA: hypothetical protein VGF79_08465 [Bacteroidia bacterium]